MVGHTFLISASVFGCGCNAFSPLKYADVIVLWRPHALGAKAGLTQKKEKTYFSSVGEPGSAKSEMPQPYGKAVNLRIHNVLGVSDCAMLRLLTSRHWLHQTLDTTRMQS